MSGSEASSDNDVPDIMASALHKLKNDFRMQDFREKQKPIIERLLVEKQSALAVLPTGSGKSLCYQLPALLLPGITLVICPLIALMKDQVDGLVKKGIPAARLDSSLSKVECQDAWRKLESGELKLLYVAPERLNMETFMSKIDKVKIDLLTVDESHCVTEWGYAFRPDYLKIARFAQENNCKRVLCLTATATPAVAQDICKAFNIDGEHGVFCTSSYCPNLHLNVQSVDDDPNCAKRMKLAVEHLRSNPGPSIVYATAQKQTEMIAQELANNRLDARHYHAGMSNELRKGTQDWFMKSENRIVCATIAFGMGIDKPDIRNVLHLNPPKTIEDYLQEVGRGGRDGMSTECIFYLHAGDSILLEHFARGNTPSRNSVRSFLKEICTQAVRNEVNKSNAVLEINTSQVTRNHDMRDVTLSLLFAQLELKFGFMRAITPAYAMFKYKVLDRSGFAAGRDGSPEEKAILRSLRAGASSYMIVDVVSASKGLKRANIVSLLETWNNIGWIELEASQRRNRYLMLNRLPHPVTEEAEILSIADQLFEQMYDRECAEVKRMEDLFALASAPKCLSKSLTQHFGDVGGDFLGEATCGVCSVCTNDGQPAVTYSPTKPPFNEVKFANLLNATRVRDDPRFLARVAFGIASPRTKALGFHPRPVFGSMAGDHVWEEVLKRCEEECERAAESLNRASAGLGASGSSSQPLKRKNTPDTVDTEGPAAKRAKTATPSHGN